MTQEEVYECLCVYDPRNSHYQEHKECCETLDLELREPRTDCACDNCYHGKDRLALEILARSKDMKYYRCEFVLESAYYPAPLSMIIQAESEEQAIEIIKTAYLMPYSLTVNEVKL